MPGHWVQQLDSNRSYFCLIYGTRHVKGLIEFRKVEKKAVIEQEQVRLAAQQRRRVERTGQPELFAVSSGTGPLSFEDEQQAQLDGAKAKLREHDDSLPILLEGPLVWESKVKRLIRDMQQADEPEVLGLKPRERTVGHGHILVSKNHSAQ